MKEIKTRVIKTEKINWRNLKFIQDEDFKEWINDGDEKLLQSILKYQFIDPFKVWEHEGNLYCLDGKHRWLDLQKVSEKGYAVPELLQATFIDCTDIKEAAELVLVYSSAYAKVTQDGLFNFITKFDLKLPDLKETIQLPEFDLFQFESSLVETESTSEVVIQSLQERFIIPPFSIFDSRQGYWQDRKKMWHKLGFDSQETREEVELISKTGQAPAVYALRNEMRDKLKREPDWDEILAEAEKRGMYLYGGASIFDPVLCEICYKWFCPEGGSILDPFAGGSVRGIVAGVLNYQYAGIDLRKDQVEANVQQWYELNKTLNSASAIAWLWGDSNQVLDSIKYEYDFVFSCPPYHDLEQYSDNPEDLSNMSYEDFCNVYRSIITKAMAKLKPNRFACFVVGDIRDKSGTYRNFVSETIDCFTKCIDDNGNNVKLYNEIILVNVAGSLPIRIGRQFGGYRKVGKMHQNVLVFFKGDPKKIKDEFPEIKADEYLERLNNNPNITLSSEMN